MNAFYKKSKLLNLFLAATLTWPLIFGCLFSPKEAATVKVQISEHPNPDAILADADSIVVNIIYNDKSSVFFKGKIGAEGYLGPWMGTIDKNDFIIEVTQYNADGEEIAKDRYTYIYDGNTFSIAPKLEVTPRSLRLLLTSPSVNLTGKILPGSSSQEMTWESKNPEIATVSQTGEVTPTGTGQTTIYAVSGQDANLKDSASVLVEDETLIVKPDSIHITSETLTLFEGGTTMPLSAEIFPANAAANLVWLSTDSSVAAVDRNGVVAPVSEGSAFIIVSTDVDSTVKKSSFVTVIKDTPLIHAGGTAANIAGSEIAFSIQVTQQYGSFTEFNYDLDGDGEWDETISSFSDPLSFSLQLSRVYAEVGSFQASFRMLDSEGNIGTAIRNISIASPGQAVITVPGQDTIVNSPEITVVYSVDGESFFEQFSLVYGENLLIVDSDVNAQINQADSVTVTLDTLKPSAPAVSGPGLTNDNRPEWSWSSGEGGIGIYRYKLNNNALSVETAESSYIPATPLADGDHTLYVIEKNIAGNWSDEGQHTITVDTELPVITLTGDNPYTHVLGEVYTDPGATATEGLTANIIVVNSVDADALGDYSVTYNVTDAAGNAASEAVRTVRVVRPAPVASFIGSPTSGDFPLTVEFSNSSTGADSYLWDFGDGESSIEANPIHEYSTTGSYSVVLIATGRGVDTLTRNAYITVGTPAYSVTFASGGNGTVDPLGPTGAFHGEDLDVEASPSTGYHFVSWTTTNGLTMNDSYSNPAIVTNITGNGTVTANFAKDTFNLTVSNDGNGATTPSGIVLAEYGAPVNINATPNLEYNFVNWTVTSGSASIAVAANALTTVTLTSGNASVQANFALKTYKVTVSAETGGSITLNEGENSVSHGGNLSIAASPDAGYDFSGWAATGVSVLQPGNASTQVSNVTSTGSVTASFTKKTYQLNITDDGNGTTIPFGIQTVEHGIKTNINISQIDAGYEFVNWSVLLGSAAFDNSNQANTNVTLTSGNATIRANFRRITYNLTLSNDGRGTTSPSGVTTVNHGTATTITATPSSGAVFVNWTRTDGGNTSVIANPNSASTTVTLTSGNAAIRANFWACGDVLQGDNDSYATKEIAGYCWMTENLNEDVGSNSCPGDYQTEDPALCGTHGRLYTWAAALNACPDGWSLPTKTQFETLVNFSGGFNQSIYIRERGTAHWEEERPLTNNNTGFSAWGAGSRYSGIWYDINRVGSYWSSTEVEPGMTSVITLTTSSDDVYWGPYNNANYFISVRCIWDTAP